MTQELNGFFSVSVGLMMKAEKTLKVNLYCMVGETDILEATLEGNSHITLCWFIEIYAIRRTSSCLRLHVITAVLALRAAMLLAAQIN